jgi:MFS family permease
VEKDQAGARAGGDRRGVLVASSQAGLVNNLNDAVAWGLAPLYLAANGASVGEIGFVAGLYPAVWGAGQLATGWLSDLVGRTPLIVTGMLVQAGGLVVLTLGEGSFESGIAAATLLGIGTALVYPTLIAAVSDAVQPRERPHAIGIYRFWRDSGLVVGAILAGTLADTVSAEAAIGVVAGLTAASGVLYAAIVLRRRGRPDRSPRNAGGGAGCDGERSAPHRPALEGRAPDAGGHPRIDSHSALGARVAARSGLRLREPAHRRARPAAHLLLQRGLLLEPRRRGRPRPRLQAGH